MNIYGIGIDIVKISRLVKLLKKKRPFKKNIFKKRNSKMLEKKTQLKFVFREKICS